MTILYRSNHATDADRDSARFDPAHRREHRNNNHNEDTKTMIASGVYTKLFDARILDRAELIERTTDSVTIKVTQMAQSFTVRYTRRMNGWRPVLDVHVNDVSVFYNCVPDDDTRKWFSDLQEWTREIQSQKQENKRERIDAMIDSLKF